MEENISSKNERKGMALSGFIISIIGLICAFIPGWRMFGLIVSSVGLGVSIYALMRAKKTNSAGGLTIPGIIFAIAGIGISLYMHYGRAIDNENTPTENAIPQELHDSVNEEDRDQSLDKLKNLIDTSQGQ
jgi:hypothetical protein